MFKLVKEAHLAVSRKTDVESEQAEVLCMINIISEEIDNFEIQILDPFGKLIIEENKKQFIGEYTKKIDLSNYPK